ncbi:MAG: TonB-dependent receptor [Rhodospirillales bacterium]|nr:TonB-dependent receptor [Rhodospirillales bacterium]
MALPPDLPRDRVSQPVVGALTTTQALATLLSGAHVGFKFVDPETVKVEVLNDRGATAPPRIIRAPTEALSKAAELEEVIVTARRREERLQSVPVSVTAFSARQLEQNNITSTQDLGLFVPSLVLNNNTGFAPGLVLRGQGSTLGAGPGVLVYFAEVPFVSGENATGQFQGGTGPGMFYDLENIQVLKGPQGTLFGRNTTGGAVLVTPHKPANNLEGYGQVTLGDYDWHEVEGVLNVPLVSDRVLLRVAADVSMRDGYTRDAGPFFPGQDYDNRDYWAFRGSLVLRPSDDFENYIIASSLYVHQTGTGGSLFAVKPDSLATNAFPGIFAYLALQQRLGPRKTELSSEQIDKQWTYGVIDIARWDIADDLIFRNIGGYLVDKNSSGIIDFDHTPFAIQDLKAPQGWAGAGKQFSEEVQLNGKSTDGRLQWTVGGYLEYDKPTATPEYEVTVPIAPAGGTYAPALIVVKGSTTQRTQAVYGQATYDLSGLWPVLDGLKLTAGLRYTWDYRSDNGNIYISTSNNSCAERVGFHYPDCNLGVSGRFHAPTWTLGIDYQIAPQTLLYIAGRRGYKSGGFNLNTPEHSVFSTFKPELVTDVEIGIKTDWTLLGVKARTNIDAFHTDYTNIQRSVTELINGLSSPVTENAAVATIEGVELEGTLVPTANTEILFAYSYLASKYDQYISPTQGSLVSLRFPFTPKDKVRLTGRYHLPVPADWGSIDLSATYLLQSSITAGPGYDATDVIHGYDQINLRLDWGGIAGGRFDASLFVTNAADTVCVTRISALYSVFGVAGASYGEPRMFGVQLRYQFGP